MEQRFSPSTMDERPFQVGQDLKVGEWSPPVAISALCRFSGLSLSCLHLRLTLLILVVSFFTGVHQAQDMILR